MSADSNSPIVPRQNLAVNHIATSVIFSPDGSYIAAGTNGGYIYIWYASTGAQLRILETGSWDIYDLAFSADSTVLAAAGQSVMLWSVGSGEMLFSSAEDSS